MRSEEHVPQRPKPPKSMVIPARKLDVVRSGCRAGMRAVGDALNGFVGSLAEFVGGWRRCKSANHAGADADHG